MPLTEWLQDKIWPLEAKMQAEDLYAGARLAILEMIKSGTVFFSDMYFMCRLLSGLWKRWV
jgi:5-methylthioadenosine/S-adenosylhomocysteine deaminase